MDNESARRFCLSLPHATEGIQWDNDLLFRIGGKIFAVLALDPAAGHRLSFKCTPEKFAELLELDGIIPAPYMARNKWVTLERFEALTDGEIKALLENSYALVFAKLTRKMQAQLKPS